MRTYEGLSVAYFLALSAAATVIRVDAARRVRGCLSALIAAVAVWAISSVADAIRDWAPLAYIAAAYWIPAMLVAGTAASDALKTTATAFERWLFRSDTALRRRLPPVPRAAVPALEVAYLACYPLVPAGFLVVHLLGTSDDVNRFWTTVLTSGYACYGTLPWLQSRPPRLLAPLPHTPDSMSLFNVFVLNRISHGWNTFPSGHAAMSIAVVVALAPVSAGAATVTAVVAAGVAIGAAAGRYHYVVDVLIGAMVAALSALIVGRSA